MTVSYNPSVVTNGLVLAYDAANIKSYDPRENLLTYSEGYTTNWTATRSSVSTNQITAPDGISTASKLIEDTSVSNTHYLYQPVSVVNNTYYTYSVYVKSSTRTIAAIKFYQTNSAFVDSSIYFNLSTGTITSSDAGISNSSITSIGNGWYRISATSLATATVSGNIAVHLGQSGTTVSYTGDGTSGLFIWGSQIEKGTTATNYIKTLATNNPRSNSVFDLSGNINTSIISSLSYSDIKAFNFNGTSDYISDSILEFPAVNNNTTILCWAWPDSTGPVNSYTGLVAFGGRANVTPSNAVLLCLNTSAATWYVGSAYWNNDYNPSNLPVSKDAWNMVGIVARSANTTNNTKLICGNASGLSSVTGSSNDYIRGVVPTKVNLTVGCTDVGGGRYMKGKIGIVLIYNRELSDTEIIRNFLAMKSRYGI